MASPSGSGGNALDLLQRLPASKPAREGCIVLTKERRSQFEDPANWPPIHSSWTAAEHKEELKGKDLNKDIFRFCQFTKHKAMRKNSKAYDLVPGGECLLCTGARGQAIFTFELKASGNFTKHLANKHEKFDELLERCAAKRARDEYVDTDAEEEIRTKRQNTLAGWVEVNKKPVGEDEITQLIASMIIMHKLPLYMVEYEGFKSLIRRLAPDYTLPARSTFMKLLDDCMATAEEGVREMLKSDNPEGISAVLDGGNVMDNRSILGYAVSYIRQVKDDDEKIVKLEPVTIRLGVEECKERHTAVNLQKKAADKLKEFGISNKLFGVATDNGSNMISDALFGGDERPEVFATAEGDEVAPSPGHRRPVDVDVTGRGAGRVDVDVDV